MCKNICLACDPLKEVEPSPVILNWTAQIRCSPNSAHDVTLRQRPGGVGGAACFQSAGVAASRPGWQRGLWLLLSSLH